jgi:RNA polymerase sigma-70 factor (ECF subfamily)
VIQGADTRNGRHTGDKEPSFPAGISTPRQGEGTPSFEDIYHEYGERVLNLLYRFTSREQVAHDLLQDVFIRVYEHMDSFENRSHIYTWIYRIAVNHALNHLKRERRNVWLDLMDETVGELLTKESVDMPGLGIGDPLRPDQLLEDKEREHFTQQAVDALHPNYRIPFLLFKDEHLSYDEIAKVMNISHSAVETRIHRARKVLIRRLSPLIK